MRASISDIKSFRRAVKKHYRAHGRELPWRKTKNHYRIVVSEIMLQQTQTERVKKFYPEFLRRFPTIRALADAPLEEILRAWQGLGYNRRAIFLKKIARRVMREHHGLLPSEPGMLAAFPGIGKNTAGAVAAFAFNIPVPFIETNIRRAIIHFFFPRRRNITDGELMPLVEKTVDRKNPRLWYYALMDYGAMLGRREEENPNRRSRHYSRQSNFIGSDRQIRGQIVRLLLLNRGLAFSKIARRLAEPPARVEKILAALEREGMIKKTKTTFAVA